MMSEAWRDKVSDSMAEAVDRFFATKVASGLPR
jgi:hypothetical protein